MTYGRLIIRSLVYHWRSSAAVVLGAAVGVAVITGSLLVGDSARESLRALALERLGPVDYALQAPAPVTEELANRLSWLNARKQPGDGLAPIIVLDASASQADGGPAPMLEQHRGQAPMLEQHRGQAAARVTVLGVDERFFPPALAERSPPFEGRNVVINQALAEALGVEQGGAIVLSLPRSSGAPAELLFGGRRRDQTVQRVRVDVIEVMPNAGLGKFSLRGDRPRPKNVFVPLRWLQEQLKLAGRVNTILVIGSLPASGDGLRGAFRIDDYGLRLVENAERGYVSLEGRAVALAPDVVTAAERAAAGLGLAATPTSVYLANSISIKTPGGATKSIPYSTIAALDLAAPAPLGPLAPSGGGELPKALQGDEILLNSWAAEDLAARPGDRVTLTYYRVAQGNALRVESRDFTVRGLVALEGAARDPGLVPEFEGLTDAASMRDWRPPFPIDLSLIRPKDEEYWNQYRATPKAFISFEAARDLWRPADGSLALEQTPWVTSLRLAPAARPAQTVGAAEAWRERFAAALLKELSPESMGLVFRPVRAEALRAAEGSTDFSGLFLGLSMFLVAASALLVGLLGRLAVEQRAKEVGLLLATGFSRGAVARLIMFEGSLLALAAALIGVPLGAAYARAILWALATLWVNAVGPFTLALHVQLQSLVIGGAAGLLVALAALGWAVLSLRRAEVRLLLGGWPTMQLEHRGWRTLALATLRSSEAPSLRSTSLGAQPEPLARRRRGVVALALALASLAGALGIVAAALVRRDLSAPGTFFGAGALLLVSGLAWTFLLLGYTRPRRSQGETPPLGLARLAARYAGRQRLRSWLTAALVACAGFAIVAVSGEQAAGPSERPGDRASGAGGFALAAETSLPVFVDMNTPEGRRALAFDDAGQQALARATVWSLRVHEGDDASCLNLQRPVAPRVVGVPRGFIERGGFLFAATESPALHSPGDAGRAGDSAAAPANPWLLLEERLPARASQRPSFVRRSGLREGGSAASQSSNGSIPAFGDEASVRWILHSGLGQTVAVPGARGPVSLRIVGLFSGSIWQSELVISEQEFVAHFGPGGGYRKFLVDAPAADRAAVAAALRRNLADLGLEVRPAHDVLADYAGVQNAYLSAFQTLGGLALILGTFAVVAVLLRGIVERRSELALMLAVGFARRQVVRLVVLENLLLVAVGLAVGGAAGLLALVPYVAQTAGSVPWAHLAANLLAVLVVAWLACTVAAGRAVGRNLLAALRAE